MDAWKCEACDYIYSQDKEQNTDNDLTLKWCDLPKDWICPVCGMGLECFSEV